jgi:L-aminopeptidase/D-esterase-like protein
VRRVRELGIVVGSLPTGERNGITDVPGVLVGQVTVAGAHSGVTAVVPAQLGDPVFAAAMDAVEEALLNSVFMAGTTTGVTGRTSHAVPSGKALSRLRAVRRET